MTQTVTTTTTVLFPIETVNLTDVKQYQLTEQHCFSLLSYRRVRIEEAGTADTAGSLIDMSKTEATRILAFLVALDARGELHAEQLFYPYTETVTNPDGSTFEKPVEFTHGIQWDFSDQHEWNFWSDRSLLITNHYCDAQWVKLSQEETIAFLAWLKEQFNGTQDLH